MQSFDRKPKRRLWELLRSQGLQMNQAITFLTDGGDDVRNLAAEMAPCAEHHLDWFRWRGPSGHVTLRLTVLGQFAKGVIHHDRETGERLARDLLRIKRHLWHGNSRAGLFWAEGLVDDLPVGILMDQLGTYLILSTLGILVVALFSPDAPARPTARSVLRKIIRFPPLIALVAGLALADVPLPGPATAALERIGATLAPLALLSVGFQLRLADAAGRGSALAAGLLFKLVLGPLLVVAILVGLLGAEGPTIQVAAFEVAMASQIGGAIVASQNRLDPPLVTLMVALGIPLSFLTLPVWWLLLQGL